MSYRWMETLLTLLFAQYDRTESLALLRGGPERDQAMSDLSGALVEAGMPPGMLATQEGTNLFVAVLALRLKFPQDEAHEKVRLNISMREGRR